MPENVGPLMAGAVPNTNAPEPVSLVTAAARFALVGVARKVATPVPSPEMLPMAGAQVAAEAAVIRPLALTVNAAHAVAEPKLPVLELTVASVAGTDPGRRR